MRRAFRDEVTATIAWIVDGDRPLSNVFTTNATFRTAYSELFYRRSLVVEGRASSVGDLGAWPAEGRLAPREESVLGEHAGVLTTPHVLLFGDTPRARMRNAYADMWCEVPRSVGATAEQVLGLGVTDLRDGAGWQQLAAMPVCGDCHARLDYGMQFFAGFPSSFVGVVFDPSRVPAGEGPLFGRDVHDLRGRAPLTPLGFAHLAVQQDEWTRCMARDVTEHVFGGTAGPAEQRAVEDALRARGTLRAMMRAALVAYARRASSAAHAEGRDARDGGGHARQELARELDLRCRGCHAHGERSFLASGALTPDSLRAMLVAVAFGSMPKGGDLDPDERRRLVRGLAEALYADPRTRAEALAYFDGAASTMPVHRGSALLRRVADRAGARDPAVMGWTFSDEARHDTTAYTPSFAVSLSYAALRMCKAAGHAGADLDECMERAAGGDVAVRSGP
jgi:hypothetical protein